MFFLQKANSQPERRDEATPSKAVMQLFGAVAAAQLAFAGGAVAEVSKSINIGDLAFDLPGSNVSKDDLPNRVKPSEAKGLPDGPTAQPPSTPSLPKLPGSNSGGPDVAGAVAQASDKVGENTPDVNVPGFGPFKFNPKEDAKQAAKKSPLGFINMGDLAFDLPGSNVSKDDLPNNVKPSEAKGLPEGPTAKPPSLPSLPKLPGSDSGGPDVAGAVAQASDKVGENTPDVNVPGFGPFKFNPKEDAKQAAKKSPLGFINMGDLAFDLPGSNVSKDDLPNNVKPSEAKGLPDGPTAKPPSLPNLPKLPGSNSGAPDVAGAVANASDKVGENTPDVNVPGFGPFKFNPKEDAKQAAKKSPLGFINMGDLAFDLPGSNVSKDDLPNKVKPSEAKGLPEGPTAKPPSLPSLPKLPGANAGKPDVAGAAKQAAKKSPLGFINMGDLAFDLPGSNVSKDDLPNKVKPSEAKGLPEGPTAKPPSLPSLPKLPGANAGKPDVAGAAKQAAKKGPLGFINMGDLAFDLPGSNVSKDDLPNKVKPSEAKGLPEGPTAKPPSFPSLPKLPGANAGKPDVAGAAKQAVKKGPLGFINMGELAFDLPGSNVSKDDLPNNVKPSEAKGLPEGPTAKPPSLPSLPKICRQVTIFCVMMLQLPGSNSGGPDVAGAVANASDKVRENTPDVNVPGFGPFKFNPKEDAKQAAKKSPLGFINVGDLAFDLPGSNVKKSDLPEGPKNLFSGAASADLPSASDLPSLPSLPGNADKVQDSLNQVSLPDVASKTSDLADVASKAGDAKDNVQSAANQIGLE
ncbi:hypothetical protein ABBQ32_010752 [Trebouxia sp. C0010 RCD-2024]